MQTFGANIVSEKNQAWFDGFAYSYFFFKK
jgi:hypothetical protein